MQTSPSSPGRRRDPERIEARRQQVLEAAAQCFRQSGFRGASMAQISALAGMSTGHIYHYFKNKEAIVEAIVLREREYILAKIDALMDEPDILQALVRRAGDPKACDDREEDPALRIEIFAETSRNPVVAELMRQHDAILRGRLQEALRLGQKQGTILAEDDLDSLTALLTSIFNGLTVRDAICPGDDQASRARLFKLLLERFLTP